MSEDNKSLDLAGLGQVAKAIPPEVYTQTTSTVLNTFDKLVAPITETTDGLGRYIKQKFDNMVEVEKAVATYTLENAVQKAKNKSVRLNKPLVAPCHNKSFVKTIEESSKETDPILHEMWENLLAEQLVDNAFHPHFVEILSHFSPREAWLLMKLRTKDQVTDHKGGYISYDEDSFTHWLSNGSSADLQPWNYSCTLLDEFRFVGLLAPDKNKYSESTVILYLTVAGQEFLKSVSP
ncbi:Abi-alpha family protein [Vibrio atypicus]|uniref:Abi-alpha family protein n=1 Tax=Vibrio atypicus TaxID=558271 RepID=UPI00135BB0E9|nr:Abi-alpha family protein [Vibrio atypicus]